jgi:hypothetical protein
VADTVEPRGAPPVVDHRPVPRGVLPRGIQTWLMAALAIGMLFIIFLTGRPEGPTVPGQPMTPAAQPNADRVRDYQERLRQLDEQASRDAREAALQAASTPPSDDGRAASPPPVNALAAERQRRDYESLFASNVVLSRRPGDQQSDASHARAAGGNVAGRPSPVEPTIDEIADAVVRASARTAGAVAQPQNQVQPAGSSTSPAATEPRDRQEKPGATGPISAVLGETRPVQSFGETRLAVSFHRLLLPDGSTVPLDQFKGLNQIGDSGLRDRVNHHYWSTFGAAAAVGLVSGLAQLLGSAGVGLGDGDRTVVIGGSGADAIAQASAQVMNRFLNRLPTITIREGHRVKVYITSDLDLPEWVPMSPTRMTGRR